MTVCYRLRNKLKLARVEKNLTQSGLADIVGVSRQTVGSIESGQYCPSTILALTIAKELGKNLDEIFYLEEVLDDEEG